MLRLILVGAAVHRYDNWLTMIDGFGRCRRPEQKRSATWFEAAK